MIRHFLTWWENFEGERVVCRWNSGSRLVFPLTSDYDLVLPSSTTPRARSMTRTTGTAITLTSGTEAGLAYGLSLIGDACYVRSQFDLQEEDRSRSDYLRNR